MLLEKLLARVNCYLHSCVLLCRNETYRKVGPNFSVCLIGYFSCGADFSKNGADFFKNGAAVLKNLVDFFQKIATLF